MKIKCCPTVQPITNEISFLRVAFIMTGISHVFGGFGVEKFVSNIPFVKVWYLSIIIHILKF